MLILHILVLALLLMYPQPCSAAARDALYIWGLDVVPSLFPYMVFCRLIASSLLQTRLPPAAVIASLGLMGGSPSGASALSVYVGNEKVPDKLYIPLAVLCGGVSPMFLLQTVRQWGFGYEFCKRLLAAHLLGASASFFFVLAAASATHRSSARVAHHHMQSSVITQSILGVLNIGACIILFSVCAESITILVPQLSSGLHGAVFHALLEMAGGIKRISDLGVSSHYAGVAISFCAGFSGFSIIMQNHSLLDDSRIPLSHFVLLSFLRGLLCAAFAWLLF